MHSYARRYQQMLRRGIAPLHETEGEVGVSGSLSPPLSSAHQKIGRNAYNMRSNVFCHDPCYVSLTAELGQYRMNVTTLSWRYWMDSSVSQQYGEGAFTRRRACPVD